MPKYLAEAIGTFALVFFGCASIVFGAYPSDFPLGILPIGLSFGLTVAAMVYLVGPISGAHLNPAVTLGVWAAGRLPARDVAPYIVAQFVGAALGAGALALIALGHVGGYDLGAQGLGQTTYDPAAWGLAPVIAVEFLGTLMFVAVILAVTSAARPVAHAGLIIGLTLMILHLMFVPVSGNSLNPARSLGPALFVGGAALSQLWLYLVVPSLAGLAAGWLTRRLDASRP
ncbi:MAG: aquaporin [Cucumibacter sp.]